MIPIRQFAFAGFLAVAVVLAACGSTASSPAPVAPDSPANPTPVPAAPAPTPVPVSTPADGTGGGTVPGGGAAPGGGGGSPPDPGGGVVQGPDQPGNDEPPGGWPGPEPTIVEPVAGLSGVHPVPATALDATVDGRHVTVLVAWWSGVEPCSVLAGVDVTRDGGTVTMTVFEGSGGSGKLACIEIAAYKGALVDLGELEPGTYTITAFGDPPAVIITVPG